MIGWFKDWSLTALAQVRNSTPVTAALILEWTGRHIDLVYKGALLLYVLLQGGYLVWKWRRDYNQAQENDHGKQT